MNMVLIASSVIATLQDPPGPFGGVPSGELFAHLQVATNITSDEYTGLVNGLKNAGLVRESNNLLSLTERGEKYATQLNALVR